MARSRIALVTSLLAVLALPCSLLPAAAQDGEGEKVFKPEQIDQLVAPIALYPDSLLAQVLMASTYPLEIVEAARWQKQNPNVTGEALETAMQQQRWDASVKSLTAFPQVLTMMNEKLDWTQQLGDAFLAQQTDVMEAVQRLRAKAHAEGNLETTKEQKVTVEQSSAPAAAQTQTTVIKVEPADPQVVYVPTYNPTVVYGAWPYPAYPPYAYYPPGYVAATSLLSFGIGMAVGSALWGDCDWGHGDVDVDVNNYNNFNKTDISNKKWEHNAEHRRGVQYRDEASRRRYNKGQAAGVDSREAFRGRAEQGRQDIARRGTQDVQRDLARSGGPTGQQRDVNRGGGGAAQQRGGAADRAGAAPRQGADRGGQRHAGGGGGREQSGRHEGMGEGRQPNAFKGMGNGPQVRQDSARGRASRQSAAGFGGGGGGGGAGGGRRGGGGGGGGGRGGGGRGGR